MKKIRLDKKISRKLSDRTRLYMMNIQWYGTFQKPEKIKKVII